LIYVSKFVSSQNIASVQENIISAVTIAFHEPAINGFLNLLMFNFSKFHFSNNSRAHKTASSSEGKLFSSKFDIFSK
jgi:hypothetical protein